MKYSEYRRIAKTGDLILFSGGSFASKIIRFVTKSNFSHCGLSMRLHHHDMLLLWESIGLPDTPDVLTSEPCQGVTMVGLSEKLRSYKGEIYVRQLKIPLETNQLNILGKFRSEIANRPYEKNILELVRSALDGIFSKENKSDLSSLFCSELVAEAYQRMGLLSKDIPSNEYTPADLNRIDGFEEAVKLEF